MHNEPAGHFNINVKIESASKPYPHLNKEGDSFEAFQRFNSKEYRRIWEGHLFLLKNYSALCNENLDNLLEVLIVKLDTSDKKGKYKSRVKEVIKGIDMPGNIQSNFLSQVFFLPDKKFTKELIENFQFK